MMVTMLMKRAMIDYSLNRRIKSQPRAGFFVFATLAYLSLYKMHQFALHGLIRTGLLTLTQLLRRTVDPSIKLH
jgi:hypothetical protein